MNLTPSLPPPREALAADVLRGLGAPAKSLPSAWFYDDEGSRLFQRIMALPAYYLTRLEEALLEGRAAELAAWMAPDARPLDLIELGSGDGLKSLALCRALLARGGPLTYHPIDVSGHALSELGQRFGQALPALHVAALRGDYDHVWPAVDAAHRQWAMFLGSNLGNYDDASATALLARIHQRLRPGDGLLLGVDLVKDPHVIRAAYDDHEGLTAEFNLNLLRRLNRELGMDFELARFTHYASYDALSGTARSFLVSTVDQTVSSTVLDRQFHFRAGETIYTEQSQKYTPEGLAALARASGFAPWRLVTDPDRAWGLALWQRP